MSFRAGPTTRSVLDGFTLAVPRNSVLALVGASGCGKTVAVRACLGLLDATQAALGVTGARLLHGSGQVTDLAGFVTEGLDADPEIRRRIARDVAVVFQAPEAHLNPYWTIERHFRMAERHRARRPHADDLSNLAARWLTAVRLLPPDRYLRRYPHQLSGGEMVRVTLSLALARQPSLLIADEPTSGLDPIHRHWVGEAIAAVTHQGERQTAILLISHDLGFVRRYAEHVAVMRDGQIVERMLHVRERGWDALRHPYARRFFFGAGVPGADPAPEERPRRREMSARRATLEAFRRTDHWVACWHD